jgi:hypothetical protein
MASLKPDWSGIVVPSKFFGSLAAGRPILFAGPEDCSVARWIRQHRVGRVQTGCNQEEVSAWLINLAASPELLAELQTRCQSVYRNYFCREKMVGAWVRELDRLASPEARQIRAAQIGTP